MSYKNFEELTKVVKTSGKKCVVVAAAQDAHALKAIFRASDEGILDYILVGKTEEILFLAKELGYSVAKERIVKAEDTKQAACQAVELIRQGTGDFLMKGKLETETLLRQVVNKENGIGLGGLMCHMALIEVPSYPKLLGLTDSGMVINPDYGQKKEILKKGIGFFHKIGVSCPKVSCLAAVEKVNAKMPETEDGAALKEEALKGEFGECYVEGPISCDLTFSREAAKAKNYKSPVTGDVDLLLVPNMVTGNIIGKILTCLAGAKMAGCVLGAKVPVVLTSRGASFEEKCNSLILCAAWTGRN